MRRSQDLLQHSILFEAMLLREEKFYKGYICVTPFVDHRFLAQTVGNTQMLRVTQSATAAAKKDTHEP